MANFESNRQLWMVSTILKTDFIYMKVALLAGVSNSIPMDGGARVRETTDGTGSKTGCDSG